MRVIILTLCLSVTFLIGALDPEPFYSNFQRIGRDTTVTYFNKKLFHDCYGIEMTNPRGTNYTLLIVTDPDWCRLIYANISEQSKGVEYLRQYGGYGSTVDKFDIPMGLCIDTTEYNDNDTTYAIYIADSKNNRITELYYKITKDSIVSGQVLISGLNKPSDVACASIAGGGAYIVVVENDNNRIKLFQRNSSGSLSLVQTYGELGSRIGQFNQPHGVSICLATDGGGGYFIYVTDTKNRRIVCLRYEPGQGISWHNQYQTFDNARFLSVAASQYYCVYVTDYIQNKILVFTHGLGTLLYKWGHPDSLNGPKDVCIDWDRLGLTERWTSGTGLQYFKIIPEVKIHPDDNSFDATVDSVGVHFDVYETHGYVEIRAAGQTIMESDSFAPDTGYFAGYWDGKDGNGKIVVPGNWTIFAHTQDFTTGNGSVIVEGTKIEGSISDLHWTPAGNPYVLVENCYTTYNDTLIIDPGVLVMGHDEYAYLYAHSGFRAVGNVNDSIIFTGHRRLLPVEDPTYPGMWNCIRSYYYAGDEQNRMEYCSIEYAKTGLEIWSAGIIKKDTVDHCYFRENVIPVRCDFPCVGIFGDNNNYYNNDTNKIIVTQLPSDDGDQKRNEDIYEFLISISPKGKSDNLRSPGNMTMKDQEIPYWFKCSYDSMFTVAGNEDTAMTLTIEPGIQIEFDPDAVLAIGDQYSSRGKLICEGLENDSIKLIGANGGTWNGIRFYPQCNTVDTSSITYTLIESGGSDTAAVMLGDSTSIQISNSKICNSPKYGLWMAHGSPYDNILISQCFFDNDSIPILSAFGNLGAIDTCSYSNNIYEQIDVVGQNAVQKDLTIYNYSLPYCFLNQDAFGSQYVLYGNGALVTLSIDAGVNILCDSAVSIEIGNITQEKSTKNLSPTLKEPVRQTDRGKIIALGTDSTPVVFTSLDKTKPWNGITIFANDAQDTSQISYCEISHALQGLAIYNTSPMITHSSIMNTEAALILSGSGAEPSIDSNLITLNTCGIYNTDTGSTSLTLYHNDIYGNKIAVKNDVTTDNVDADSNFWGASSGPWDPTDAISGPPDYNPSGTGDSIGDYVVYRHWLTQSIHEAQVTLNFPNGEESLHVEIDTIIHWTRSLEITPVKQELYYTTDFPEGGSIRESLLWQFIDTVNVNDTNYTWNVPMTISERCRVGLKLYYETGAKKGISSSPRDLTHSQTTGKKFSAQSNTPQKNNRYSNGNLFDNDSRSTATIAVDISNANFMIIDTVSPQVSLNYPTGSEYFIPTEQETIQWQASDNHKLDHFDIFLSEDGGYSYSDTITEDLEVPCSTYIWTVPEKNNYNCKIMVVAYDSSANDNNDACDSIFYIPVKSFSDYMSAFNNATRMVRSFSSNIHLVYSTNESGELIRNKANNFSANNNHTVVQNGHFGQFDGEQMRGNIINYIKSTNFGVTWQNPTEVGDGIYPALSMNDNATKMGATWQNSDQDEIYYRYWTPMGGWARTDTLFETTSDITYSPPAIAFANDTMHLTTIRTEDLSRTEIVQDVLYAKFYWSNASATMSLDTVNHWRITYSGDYPQFSSITVDGSNRAHVTWERPPDDTIFTTFTPFDIHYQQQGGLGISAVFNVSNSDSNSINPSIECYGGHYYIVWQEKIDGYNIFLYKRNYAGFPPSSQTDTISQSAGEYPVTSMGGVVLWASGDTADIYGRIWDSDEEEWLDITNWSNTPRHSMYPQVDAWQDEGGLDLIAGWTEDTDTSGFGKKFVSIFPYGDYRSISFPSYFLDLGDSLSTPYTQYRESYTSINEKWYDFGEDSLSYSLPIINQFAKCRLYVELFRPESTVTTEKGKNAEKGINWRIRLNVDNLMHEVITLAPGETKKLNLDVPWLVNIDGSALIKFRRIIGDGIFARRILFYEYERIGSGEQFLAGGDPQSSEEMNLGTVCFEYIYPNPTKETFLVKVNTPVETHMAINIYDVAGRLVENLFSGRSSAGINEFSINRGSLSSGVYFIKVETEGYTETQKVILVQ